MALLRHLFAGATDNVGRVGVPGHFHIAVLRVLNWVLICHAAHPLCSDRVCGKPKSVVSRRKARRLPCPPCRCPDHPRLVRYRLRWCLRGKTVGAVCICSALGLSTPAASGSGTGWFGSASCVDSTWRVGMNPPLATQQRAVPNLVLLALCTGSRDRRCGIRTRRHVASGRRAASPARALFPADQDDAIGAVGCALGCYLTGDAAAASTPSPERDDRSRREPRACPTSASRRPRPRWARSIARDISTASVRSRREAV